MCHHHYHFQVVQVFTMDFSFIYIAYYFWRLKWSYYSKPFCEFSDCPIRVSGNTVLDFAIMMMINVLLLRQYKYCLINRSLNTGSPYTETTGSVQEPWQDLQWQCSKKKKKSSTTSKHKTKTTQTIWLIPHWRNSSIKNSVRARKSSTSTLLKQYPHRFLCYLTSLSHLRNGFRHKITQTAYLDGN